MNFFGLFIAASAMFIPEFSLSDLRYLASNGDGRADREILWSAALIEILIAPDGKVADCSVVRFAGDKKAADQNCKILKKRRFSIPIGPDGKPGFAVVPAVLTTYSDRPSQQKFTNEFDARLKADKLPMKIEVPMAVFVEGVSFGPAFPDPAGQGAILSVATTVLPAVNVRIDSIGNVSDCAGTPGMSEALIRYACEKAVATSFGTRTVKGKPVSYLRHLQLYPTAT